MRRFATPVWFALVLLPCLVTAPRLHAASLTIAPAETTITSGDSFTLRVLIDVVPDLKGAELVYDYTPGQLTFGSAQVGDALAGTGATMFEIVLPDVTSPADSVWYNAARLTGTGSGPGVVVFLHFDSHAQGNATVHCLTSDLRDTENLPLSPTCASALVHVEGPVPALRASWGRLKASYR